MTPTSKPTSREASQQENGNSAPASLRPNLRHSSTAVWKAEQMSLALPLDEPPDPARSGRRAPADLAPFGLEQRFNTSFCR